MIHLSYNFGSGSLGPAKPRRVKPERAPKQIKRARRPHDLPKPEALIAFGLWAATLARFPTVRQIADRYETIDRATVYRWRNHLAAAMGLEHPPATLPGQGIPAGRRT